MKNIFQSEVSAEIIGRIQQLTPDTQPLWGKMSVAQMLAHCCVTYEMLYESGKFPPVGGFKRLMLKLFVKNAVVGSTPYKRNSMTAPEFLISDAREFAKEQARLIGYIERTQQLGEAHFEGKESRSFGVLSAAEWNVMFYKHLDHHLSQFGV